MRLQSAVSKAMRERTGGDPNVPLVNLDTGSGDTLQVFIE